jgi:pimeloyl-ACP methyl ester carboxylesterase
MKKKYVEFSNGEKIYYLDEGQGEVLVLIHGNMSSSIHFKPMFDSLKDKYRLIAPDLRGFGDSSYKNPINSLNDLGEDVFILLDALKVDKYFLGGWSTGGAIAMKMAAKRPEDVKKLVLIESCSYRGYPIFKKNEQGQPIIGEYYSSRDELALDPVQVKPMEDLFNTQNAAVMTMIWDQVIYTVGKPNPLDAALYMSETMKQRNIIDIDWGLTSFNMSNFTNGVTLGDNTIKDIVCPVLTLWGDRDITVLEYMIDETVEALKDVKKVILKNSGHSPFVDCPDELIKNIVNFIY